MRTMWNEFPSDLTTYDMHTQFMFGSQILVAPKLKEPSDLLKLLQMQEVDFYLPEGYWYNLISGVKSVVSGFQTV
jgi:alpha-D-xyloside xylohydrolase